MKYGLALLSALLSVLVALPVSAEIYKCRLPGGGTEISNAPCAGGSGTLSVRPDEPVSDSNRQQAERDVDRMRSYVEKREAAQRAEEAAERERQASQRQPAGSSAGNGRSVDECLRELDSRALDVVQRANLEAACRGYPPPSQPVYVPVPVPVEGGYGKPPHRPPPPPVPRPPPPGKAIDTPHVICPLNNKNCTP